MDKYDAARRCPKCGGSDVATTWVEGWCTNDAVCWEKCHDAKGGEHLHRDCETCGFGWPESCVAPEDAKPEPYPKVPVPTAMPYPPCPRCGYPGNAGYPWPGAPSVPWTQPYTWITTGAGTP